MKLVLRGASKGQPLPSWPFVGFGIVLVLSAAWIVSHVPVRLIPPCGFHVVTGHPCPTCGATRMLVRLLRGEFGGSFHANPFFFIVMAVLALWAVAGMVTRLFGRNLSLQLSRREEGVIWVLLLVGFLANWVYLWKAGI